MNSDQELFMNFKIKQKLQNIEVVFLNKSFTTIPPSTERQICFAKPRH